MKLSRLDELVLKELFCLDVIWDSSQIVTEYSWFSWAIINDLGIMLIGFLYHLFSGWWLIFSTLFHCAISEYEDFKDKENLLFLIPGYLLFPVCGRHGLNFTAEFVTCFWFWAGDTNIMLFRLTGWDRKKNSHRDDDWIFILPGTDLLAYP